MNLITPAQLEALTGHTVENQRAWERAGVWCGRFERTKGGQRRFRKGDVIFVAASRIATVTGLELKVATAAIDAILPQIVALLRGKKMDGNDDQTMPLVVWPTVHSAPNAPKDVWNLGESGFSAIRLADLRRIPLYATLGAVVLDPRGLAEALPQAVKDLVLVEAEK